MDWTLQRAAGSDLDELAVLVQRCLGRGWGRSSLETALGSQSARIQIARQQTGELIGFVVARRVADLLEIDLLGVAPEKRRRGAAAALLERLIASEQIAGVAEVRLELRASNSSAQALYAGLGFVVVGRRARYYPDGEDALLLTRAVSLPGG